LTNFNDVYNVVLKKLCKNLLITKRSQVRYLHPARVLTVCSGTILLRYYCSFVTVFYYFSISFLVLVLVFTFQFIVYVLVLVVFLAHSFTVVFLLYHMFYFRCLVPCVTNNNNNYTQVQN